MNSLRLRFTLWFGLCLFAVVGVFMVATHYHLEYELRREAHERRSPADASWSLHGTYSEAEVHDIVAELWRSALLYAGPLLLLSLVVGFLLARRAFAPVADMRRQLHAINARNLTDRIRLADADREFQAIEAAINALLTRLETTFAQLNDYSAQVAHELRTPLTLLRLQVEEAADKIPPQLSESLQEELARLSDYVDQCLLLATAEQGRLKTAPELLDLRTLLGDVLDNFTLLARSEGREIQFQGPVAARVFADPRHLRQILHILLANAVQHGVGAIAVLLQVTAAGVVCRIENPVAPTAGPRHWHAGLGLRIARAIAASQGFAFSAQPVESRFAAELRLPSGMAETDDVRWAPGSGTAEPRFRPAPASS